MKLSSQIRRKRSQGRKEDGYVLLTLLLIVAVAAIVFTFGVLPTFKFNMQRDNEEEMIHRGVQYSRAVRAYYKKFGRYPSKIEDLENTNQVRFLRKRYKDPTNCKKGKCEDFKIVHFGEVQLVGSMGMGAPAINGASPIGGNGSGLNGSSGFGSSNSSFGQSSSFGQNSSFGQSSSFGQNGQNNPNGTDSAQNPQAGVGNAGTDANGNPVDPSTGQPASGQQAGQQFGGGAMIGVAPLSKQTTIREYNKKKKYNEWLFVFDPSLDRGGLITTPYQPLQAAFGMGGTPPNLNGQINGTAGTNNGGFSGQPPAGMLNDPDLNRSGAPSNPPQ